jgi:hypothetical protein
MPSNTSTTRSEKKKQEEAAKKHKLDASNILPSGSKRKSQPPDYLAHPPKIQKDRHGNKILLPGSAAITSIRMKVSGDSLKDIKKLEKETGRGGSQSDEVWHHQSDYDSKTKSSTVTLMPKAAHASSHVGSSAFKRADMHDDPDKKAKYGLG